MTAMMITSAYRQLRPAQKLVVDALVSKLEREAEQRGERISNALYRPIASEDIDASEGLLDNALVRAAIVERINELAAASELTPQRVIKEYMAVAFTSLEQVRKVDDDGSAYIDLNQATPEFWKAVKSIEVEETGDPFTRGRRKTKLILHDKLAALDKLSNYMGLLAADNPEWRADNARPVPAALPAGTTPDEAANTYGQMING